MLKVAILGYGRQGKKHKIACEHYGITPEIFTKSGLHQTQRVSEFKPKDYSLIVCAISPIDEQTKMIESILNEDYENYLIIEKPITYSRKLLERLKVRKRTLFFIDEAYNHKNSRLGNNPKAIHTTSAENYSSFAIAEHAIGNFLTIPENTFDYTQIQYTHSVEKNLTYTIIFEGNQVPFFQDMKDLNFFFVYQGMLSNLKNEAYNENIRNSYYRFRTVSKEFAGFLK